MKTLIIGLLAGGAVLASAGIANATPQEDAVIAQLDGAGYHFNSIPGILKEAHKVCNRVAVGQSRDQIAGDLVAAIGDPVKANTFVDISIANLCP